MSLEQQLAEAIASQNALTQAIANKRAEIDAGVAAQAAAFAAWKNDVKGIIPLPSNLVANAAMTKVTNGIPDGFGSAGLTLEAVSSYTRGFEGPYLPEAPASVALTPDDATGTKPYYYGVYNMGPRTLRGGLADGWAGLGSGRILKITAQPGAGQRMLSMSMNSAYLGAATNIIRLRCYLKIVRADHGVGFGEDSGYYGAPYGDVIQKSATDTGPQGWKLIDIPIGLSQKTRPLDGFYMGFSRDDVVEAYLALPYIFVPSSANIGIVF